MSSLQLPGLFTGIDTATIVTQLIALQRRRLVAYEDRKSQWEERQDSLSELESKLRSFRTSIQALSDSDLLKEFSVSSSDSDIITAEATNQAFEGNHTVVVNQLATSERWVHTAGLEYAENLVGAGTFIYSYNHKESSIETTADTTLEDLVGLINNDADNPGVTASLLYYNNAFHMVLNGNDAGSDYSISVNASNTEIWEMSTAFTQNSDNATLSTKLTQLDQFTENAGLVGDEQIIITGTDHHGNSVSSTLNVNENIKLEHLIGEINDAFDGSAKAVFENGKIVLTDTTSGTSSISLSLTYDNGTGDTQLTLPTVVGDWSVTEGGTTSANLANFTQSDFTKSQAAQDSKIKVDGFPSTSAASEVQTMTLTAGNPNNGHYHLTYNGQTTGEIAYNADAATIQAALEALSNVNTNDIVVTAENT
ncbi:MAG: flagellar cap protein FliD N-terminal domain-containing protein, partial [Planctomycetota bacterium]